MNRQCWPRGSEWRKWDLHVHSPASSGFMGDYNQFIIQLGNADCDVIGINDYFSVAGYREVLRRLSDPAVAAEGNKAYRESLERLRDKTLLPVVECRMNNVLVNKKGAGQRINFHVIFDPAVSSDDIETFLKGQKVKDSSVGQRYADSRFLLNDVSVDFNAVRQTLQGDGTFRGRHLIWLPYDEYGGIDGINPNTDRLFKENLICSSDILGSSNKTQSDFFLWKDPTYTEEQCRAWFGVRKPCIKGSDSHNVNDELGKLKDHNSKPTDRYCWIKADPTFAGLRQIITEPEDRVYIGKLPPKVEEVHANATRFIDRILVGKTTNADTNDVWFDCDLPLNADMVAIIGNKGSGKSALADILALAGNTHCDPGYFSFLNKQRFCERNGKLAKQFESKVIWFDGTESAISLSAKPDLNGVELLRYIPQTYLEKVCTEMEPGQRSEFQIELRKVTFSHISDADRLGKETLDELIQYKTEELKGQIGNARREIARVNIELTRLEDKGTHQHIAQLEANLRLRQQELKAHTDNQPKKVEQPSDISPEQKAETEAVATRLVAERATLQGLDTKIAQQSALQKTLTEKVAIARKVEGKIDNFEAECARLERETEADLEKLGVKFGSIFVLTVNKDVVVQARQALVSEKALVDADLAPETATGVAAQRAACLARITALQDQLDAPNKQYQQYIEAHRVWQEKAQAIEGSAEKPNTLLTSR